MRLAKADKADVMGQRAFFGPNRELLTYKDRVFQSEGEAREYAASVNVDLAL
jgi:hypothetical protein